MALRPLIAGRFFFQGTTFNPHNPGIIGDGTSYDGYFNDLYVATGHTVKLPYNAGVVLDFIYGSIGLIPGALQIQYAGAAAIQCNTISMGNEGQIYAVPQSSAPTYNLGESQLYYNSTEHTWKYYNGTVYINLTAKNQGVGVLAPNNVVRTQTTDGAFWDIPAQSVA